MIPVLHCYDTLNFLHNTVKVLTGDSFQLKKTAVNGQLALSHIPYACLLYHTIQKQCLAKILGNVVISIS